MDSENAGVADTKRFLLDLAEDWQQHGREVFKRVRRESPAAYLKVCAMLVPKEMKVDHSASAVKQLTDAQLEAMIEYLESSIEAQVGGPAKVIEGTIGPAATEATAPLVSPKPMDRLMLEADTAIGPRERKPRKRKVPSSSGADVVP